MRTITLKNGYNWPEIERVGEKRVGGVEIDQATKPLAYDDTSFRCCGLCGGRDWCPGDKPFILLSRLLGKIEGPEARSTLKVPVKGFWLRVTCVGAC
jgi:hypothetical protein